MIGYRGCIGITTHAYRDDKTTPATSRILEQTSEAARAAEKASGCTESLPSIQSYPSSSLEHTNLVYGRDKSTTCSSGSPQLLGKRGGSANEGVSNAALGWPPTLPPGCSRADGRCRV
ncbi:hypothetical protein CIRG_10126 [Coccidioides immitis RMSCC 2394]|uniref:Uncharacterized protein n=1 Tax=Coccidioides immitis RMSCC 2394 TaxID=404692 RepID=A0A0J6Y6L2_COCIT|nr:hypothetical protein CIRG_10126 [Coccidioides immitis RMSCC 2394]